MDELKDLELTDVVVTDKEIGRGSYGYVVELKVKGLKCAGKILHDKFFDSVGSSESSWISSVLARECIQHSKLHHPNIVECFGVHTPEGYRLPILVMELMHMSLSHCLEKYRHIPARLKYGVLHDVSLGVQYLHDHNPPIVHRDLTANNVLLTRDMRAKVADFGVSRVIDGNRRRCTLTQAPGAQIYMSPESLVPSPRYNQQLDVFSFGVLIIHVVLQVLPIPECGANRVDEKDPNKLIAISEVDRRANLLKRMASEPALKIIATNCLSNHPDKRPLISRIVSDLDTLVSQSTNEFPFLDIIQALKLQSNAQIIQAQLHTIVDSVKSNSQWSAEFVSGLTSHLKAVSNLSAYMMESSHPTGSNDENRLVVSYTPPSSADPCDLKITIAKNACMSLIVRPPVNMTFSGTYVKTIASGLTKAWGVAVGKKSDQVFVVDHEGSESVLMYYPNGSKKVLLASNSVLQMFSLTNLSVQQSLSCWYPCGIAFDENEKILLVADSGSKRILKMRVPEIPTEKVVLLAKSKEGVFTGTAYHSQVGIGVTKEHLVIVCNRESHELVILDSNLNFVRKFGLHGNEPCQFRDPWDVAFDSHWNIYVTDNSNACIKVFSPDFKPLRTIGCPGPDVCNLRAPTGICIDSNDYIYVADKWHRKVFVFDPAGNFKMRFGEYGNENGQFIKPLGITVDSDCVVYVTDGEGGRVQAFK